jgi:hypothetical protein
MTSEYVNLGTKPNVDVSRENDFVVKSVKDEKMNNYKDVNHCEIDLFSSSNLTKTDNSKFMIEETHNNRNSKVVNRNKESWDTEQISKQLYPVHENNLDFLVESPGDDSKNSNENNETKIKETNYHNYNKVSKGNYNDTITSTFSNNYTNKIANQNRTIFNLENLKQIMSIENFENTNKNMIDLTNRNMVNSYLSNKNNLDTEKKEFLKKLMYFSNKNNSVINNISPSNSIAPNSKNISPKRKIEETTGDKFVDEIGDIKNPFNIYAAEINLFDEENKTVNIINDALKKSEEKVEKAENGDFFLNKRKNKHSINVIKNRLLSSNILNSYDESILDNYNSVDEKVSIKKKKISKSFSQKNEECLDKEENTNLNKKDIKNRKTKINEKKNNKNEKNNSKINDLLKSPNGNGKEKKQNLNDKEKNKNPTKLHQSNLTKKPNISKVQQNNSNLVNYLKKSMLDLKKVNKKEPSKDVKTDKNNNGTNNGNNIESMGVKKRIILSDINSKISSIDDKSNTLITSLQLEPSKKHHLEIENNNYEFKPKMRTPNSHSLFDYANFSIDILDDGKKKRQNYIKKYRELNRIFSNTLSLLSIII